jgi:hypothetical protein
VPSIRPQNRIGGPVVLRKDSILKAHLRRPSYTKAIPPEAEFFERKGKQFVRFTNAKGRVVQGPVTPGGRVRLKSRVWHGYFRDADGHEQDAPLSANHVVAEQLLRDLVRKAELGRAGNLDPCETQRKRPLREHLADWEATLRADGAGKKHIAGNVACVRRILDGCGFVFMADVSGSRVQRFLAELRQARSPVSLLDPAMARYTKAEVAALLRVSPPAVTKLVGRYRLEAAGNGKARRYPRTTVEALLSLRRSGKSIRTSNQYLPRSSSSAAGWSRIGACVTTRWLICPAAM